MEMKGIPVILIFVLGVSIGYFGAPRTVKEVIVEIEKIVEIPSSNQKTYSYCTMKARGTLYSSWSGKPEEGTTPKNTQTFIDDCYNKLKI